MYSKHIDSMRVYRVWITHQMNQTKRVVPCVWVYGQNDIGTKKMSRKSKMKRRRTKRRAKTNYKCPMNFIQKAHAANPINNQKRRMNCIVAWSPSPSPVVISRCISATRHIRQSNRFQFLNILSSMFCQFKPCKHSYDHHHRIVSYV